MAWCLHLIGSTFGMIFTWYGSRHIIFWLAGLSLEDEVLNFGMLILFTCNSFVKRNKNASGQQWYVIPLPKKTDIYFFLIGWPLGKKGADFQAFSCYLFSLLDLFWPRGINNAKDSNEVCFLPILPMASQHGVVSSPTFGTTFTWV